MCVCVYKIGTHREKQVLLPLALYGKAMEEQSRDSCFSPYTKFWPQTHHVNSPPSAQQQEQTTRIASWSTAASPLLPSEDNKGKSDRQLLHTEWPPGLRMGGEWERSLSLVTLLHLLWSLKSCGRRHQCAIWKKRGSRLFRALVEKEWRLWWADGLCEKRRSCKDVKFRTHDSQGAHVSDPPAEYFASTKGLLKNQLTEHFSKA